MRKFLIFLLIVTGKSFSSNYDQCIEDGGTPEICLGVEKVSESLDDATRLIAVGAVVVAGYAVFRFSEDKKLQWDKDKISIQELDNGLTLEINFANPNQNQYFNNYSDYYLGITLRF
jgi:hypothetical protein